MNRSRGSVLSVRRSSSTRGPRRNICESSTRRGGQRLHCLRKSTDTELAIFCESKYQWLDLMEKIQGDKRTTKGTDRFDVVMAAKFMQQMHMSGDRLGLSPVARTRLGTTGQVEDDEFGILS
jgi:hypothetical protein